MVFGNRGDDSGTGVAFTRDPVDGREGALRRLPARTRRARTWWRASATPCSSRSWSSSTRPRTRSSARRWTRSRATTATCATSSSRSRRASCGCCRPGSASGPRSPSGSWPTTCSSEGLIDADEALLRVDANRLEELFKRRVAGRRRRAHDRDGPERVAGRGDRQGRVQRRRGAGVGRAGRAGDPGPPRDHPRRLPRHDRLAGHPDQRRRDQLARGGGRPGRGHPGGVRRRRDQARRRRRRRSRAERRRRCTRATSSRSTGSPARSTSGELPLEESPLEKARSGDAAAREREDLAGLRAVHGPGRRGPAAPRPRERRHARPVDERARARRRGHRPVPHRAHVPGRGAGRRPCGR